MPNDTIKRAQPTPPEYLQRIGKITSSFAMLEQVVAFLIWTIISDDSVVGQIITAELNFKQLLSLLSSLYRHKRSNETKINELEHLLKRAMQVSDKRNVICHSIWGAGDAAASITRIKTTAKIAKGLRRQFQQTTVKDLDSIIQEIQDVIEDISAFTNGYIRGSYAQKMEVQ
jgi:hypothetical protein